jgi:hypothetical protein
MKKGSSNSMNHRTHVLFALFALAGVGCGPSKVDQCNAFIDEGNKAQSAFVALQAALLSPTALQTRIDKIDGSVKALRGVKLADAKLVAMRDKYATELDGYAKILTQMKPILKDEAKVDDFNKQVDKLNAISTAEEKLIDEINAYCSEGK